MEYHPVMYCVEYGTMYNVYFGKTVLDIMLSTVQFWWLGIYITVKIVVECNKCNGTVQQAQGVYIIYKLGTAGGGDNGR